MAYEDCRSVEHARMSDAMNRVMIDIVKVKKRWTKGSIINMVNTSQNVGQERPEKPFL
jgi:hypothetical protein